MIKDMLDEVPKILLIIWAIFFIIGLAFAGLLLYGLWKLVMLL